MCDSRKSKKSAWKEDAKVRKTNSWKDNTEKKPDGRAKKEGNKKKGKEKEKVEIQEDSPVVIVGSQSHSLSNGSCLACWVEACLCSLSDTEHVSTSSQTSEDRF